MDKECNFLAHTFYTYISIKTILHTKPYIIMNDLGGELNCNTKI